MNSTGFATVVALACWVASSHAVSADSAEAILDATGVRGGLIVHLGSGDGTLTAALRINDRFVVHGLDTDSRNVERGRRHVRSRGLYGPVSVEGFDGSHLPYTDITTTARLSWRWTWIPVSQDGKPTANLARTC